MAKAGKKIKGVKLMLFSWTKSTRSIAVVIFTVGLTVALFTGSVPAEMSMNAAMLVLGAYFGKRDTPEDRK